MFNTLPSLTRALSFSKIISGISKTLNVANQVIPLYLKARPIISNAKGTLGMIKEFTSKMSTKETNKTSTTNNQVKEKPTNIEIKKEENEPTFFL